MLNGKLYMPLALLILLQWHAGAAAEPLRVMSFNIRYGTAPDGENAWPHRKGLVVKVLQEEKPDLVGLQEALRDQIEVLVEALPELTLVGVGRDANGGGEYSAILYRRSRFDLSDAGTFWLSETPEVPGSRTWGNNLPRICTWARLLDRSNKRRFVFFNTHWDHESQSARVHSGELMGKRIAELTSADEPAVVTGDFNAAPENPAFMALLEVGQLQETFSAVHPEEKDLATFNGFGQKTHTAKIDAVLATGDWKVEDAEIVRTREGDRYPSDHFPVTATLTLRDAAAREPADSETKS
jgi:endonuclease/exonuclease/phosphatase family metal-dependent hydrolase